MKVVKSKTRNQENLNEAMGNSYIKSLSCQLCNHGGGYRGLYQVDYR